MQIVSFVLGIIASVIGALIVWGWIEGRVTMRLRSKRERENFLRDVQKADFLQRKQRDVFRYLGLAIYFLGCAITFSLWSTKWAFICRFVFGVAVILCGGMTAANAAAMNEYGISQIKKSYENEERKEQQRIARKRERDNVRY